MPIVVTGRDSAAVRRRMADLGVFHAAYGAADKMAAAAALVDGLGLDWDRVAAMGDDWPDLPRSYAARALYVAEFINGMGHSATCAADAPMSEKVSKPDTEPRARMSPMCR